jgi:trigger factor
MAGPPKKPGSPPSVRGRPQGGLPGSSGSPDRGGAARGGARQDARAVSFEAGRALQRALDSAPAAAVSTKVEGPSRRTAERALAAAETVEVSVAARPITKELVAFRLEELRRLISMTEPRAFGTPIAMGDEVELDMLGYLEGQVFLAQQATWFDLKPNPFLPGLFEALAGVVPPDNVVLQLRLPAHYPVEEQRNKVAAFAVTVRRAQHRIMPEADDPIFLQLTHRKVKTRKELEEVLKAELVEERARLCVDEAKFAFLRQLYTRIGLDDDVPDELVDEELRNRWKQQIGDAMALHGVSVDEQKRSLAEFATTNLRAEARRTVWEHRCLEAIADAHAIEASEAEVNKLIHEMTPLIRSSDIDAVLYQNATLSKDIVKNLRLHRALLMLLGKARVKFVDAPPSAGALSPLVPAGSGASSSSASGAPPSSGASKPGTDVTAARGLRRPSGR